MADTQIPKTANELVDFYAAHFEIWEQHALQIGLSTELVTAVKDASGTAVAARNAAIAARNASKLATSMYHDKVDILRSIGGAAVATIRAFAEATDNSEVYDLAKLSPPAPPSPAGPATAPTEFTADPNADGTITLRWKGTIARGQTFDIERSIDGGPAAFIKNMRGKKYIDTAVPTGAVSITYRAWGVRNNVRSETSASTQVLFGTLPPALQAVFKTGNATLAA